MKNRGRQSGSRFGEGGLRGKKKSYARAAGHNTDTARVETWLRENTHTNTYTRTLALALARACVRATLLSLAYTQMLE